MAKTAFLCIDEGAARVGMGVDFAPIVPAVADLFELAKDASMLDLFAFCSQGPLEELNQTQNAQPCVMVTALAAAYALRQKGIEPDCVAGLGAGEYAAHVLAGTIDEERAVMLVARRGAMMAMGKQRGEGGMQMAAHNMERAFKSTIFMQPKIPLYSSVTAAPLDANDVNDVLLKQITDAPKWDETLSRMMDDGVTRFIECGPGRRLTSDVERIAQDKGVQVEAISVGDALDLGLFEG